MKVIESTLSKNLEDRISRSTRTLGNTFRHKYDKYDSQIQSLTPVYLVTQKKIVAVLRREPNVKLHIHGNRVTKHLVDFFKFCQDKEF